VGSLERKMKRNQDKELRKAEKKIATKIAQFGKLPNECLTCEKEFDKKNKEMVTSWYVVQSAEKNVRLYCPPCWESAEKLVKEYMENKNG
tara:strand:- start:626 stop:895 length:270 start_codon:yes stop_codon:yes gene_type:complete